MTSCRQYAARLILGQITIDDVPEARQRSVQWLVRRCGPEQPADTAEDVVIRLMEKIERLRKR